MMEEVVENQRWYTLSGWSDKLLDKDPPSWSDASLTVPKDKAKFADYHWEIYKGKDEYDENGWIYNSSFDKGEFGKKGASTVVRSRVWIGVKPERDGNPIVSVSLSPFYAPRGPTTPSSSMKSAQASTNTLATPPVGPDVHDLTPHSPSNGSVVDRASSTSSVDETVHCPHCTFINPPGALQCSICQWPIPPSNAEYPSHTPTMVESHTPASPSSMKDEGGAATPAPKDGAVASPPSSSSSGSYLGVFSSALRAVHEVSAYAYDTAHMATVSAFDATPVNVPHQARLALQYATDASGTARRFPDLSPFEKQLVSCCAVPSKPDEAPVPIESPTCKVCQTPFSMVKYRYFCGYCAEAYCRDHLVATNRLYAYGGTKLSKICATCVDLLAQKVDFQQRHWRVERVKDYLAGILTPYVSITTDTALDKACRAAEGTLAAAKNVPLGATARMAVVSADFIRKYGRAGLLGFVLRNEFMQSFNTLRELLGDMESLTVQDASLGMYYFMATNRGTRGANPTLEEDQHVTCPVVADDLLARMIKYAPITLHCVYELDILDMQRFAKLQGYRLVYASVENRTANQPAFGLVVQPDEKLGILMIRGSKSVQDVLTDLQIANLQATSSTGPLDSFAHHGMAQAATWVKHQVHESLKELHRAGYRLMINGHSLGGGVAALLSVMLHDEFPDLECFAYAVPACANREIAEKCVPYVHSIVLRDDFVPRAKTHNIVKLSTDLKDFRDNWSHTVQEDLNAVKSRVVSLWAPRKREWAQQEAASKRGVIKAVKLDVSESSSSGPKADEEWTLNRNNLMDKYKEASPGSTTMTPPSDDAVSADDLELESDNATELFVPGTITHIYYVHGVYEAVHVSRDCESLSRIQVFESMLLDHLGRNYLEALRNVRDARRAPAKPPAWVPFETHTRCQCCESPFTWNSTSSSEAQANVDQHNCRNCGWLICDGCSQKRASLPQYGINTPVRVCDRCFYQL
ncbi:Aste57867_5605 [Aphanomyces stellatus]|uniref:sn-1-specific diacylglycerol lipase n=1 Tax=Aphanomyces stellatus TaxID=120398 RepID=A0A485KH34_9STRA|nr:hypothetical protein As57867_005592 [Aphanomyces stellatus]VFT82651.1 Aste57867_5605 [Aphanomyces stellatus]